jgi:ribosomal protein S18 acetylase RimI-like enzyme
MGPTFRIAVAADLEALHSMISEYHREDNVAVAATIARSAVAELVANPQLGQVWVLCDGDRRVGYAVLTFGFSIEFGGRDAFIDELYIAEEFRGRGWGRLAINTMAEKGREAGVHALHLEVTRGNTRALELYRSSGYEEHDRYLMTCRIE